MKFVFIFMSLVASAVYGQRNDPELANFRARFLKAAPQAFEQRSELSELGRKLFFDARLSGNDRVSCATCHNPQQEWSETRATSVGFDGQPLLRRSPSLWNAGYLGRFFWDGRATQLEGQVVGPLFNPEEMANTPDNLVERLTRISDYPEAFARVYGNASIEVDRIVKAIATFERTLVDEESPFDRFVAGNDQAISAEARRGFKLFNSPQTSCVSCHGTWRLTLDGFFDIGLKGQDRGRGEFYRQASWDYAFKAPSLRRVSKRTHFMHDGRFTSLGEVLNFYNRGGDVNRPTKLPIIRPLGLNEIELKELEAFLQTL